MNKKNTLLLLFFIISFFVKAQITSVSYPSGYLSEEKISRILDKLKKGGASEAELINSDRLLHINLKKQEQMILNGTYNPNERTTPLPRIVNAGPCVNPGFEDGTTNGWTMNMGTASGATLPCPTCFTAAGGVFEVTTAGATSTINTNTGNNVGGDASGTCSCDNSDANDCTTEPYTAGLDRFGGFSVVAPAPLGGVHSCLLNNSTCGYSMQEAVQSFVVSAANNAFTFQYAVVLQDGGHPLSAAPYFNVAVTNAATGAIIPCTSFSASAEGATSGNLAGWTKSTVDASVYWYPWTTVAIDLSAYIGVTVDVKFDVSDCNAGGHFGYAYIDASCNPNQITLTKGLCAGGAPAILTGPPGLATYAWTGPVTGNTQSLTTSTPGNYTLTTTLVSGCPAPLLYYNLTESPQPVPSFTDSSPPCSGSLSFTDQSTVPTGTITNWVWNFGDGSPSVDATSSAVQNHAYTTPGNYIVTLTDTTDQHCVATYSFMVTAGGGGPNPVFTSNSPATAPQCLTGNNVVFTNSSTATGAVVITGYIWDYGDGSPTVTSTTTTPNPPNHTYAAAGTYVVTLTVSVTGCSSTTTQTVVINPMPTASFTVPAVCVGNPSVFTSTTTNAGTYSWTFGDGVGTSTVADPTYTYTSSTGSPYAVSLIVTSTGGCTVTATGSAIVSPVPTASFSVAPVCEGTASFFDATASTPSVGATYGWSFGGAAPNTDVVTTQTDNHTYSAAGTFPVTLVVLVGTCSATATGNAVVNVVPTASFSAPTVCQGNPTVFSTNITNGNTYSWTFGDAANGTSTVQSPTYNYATYVGSPFSVSLTVTAVGGCSVTATNTVVVNPVPTASFTVAPVCQGTGSVFNSTVTLNNTCAWNFGAAGQPASAATSCAAANTFTYSAAGTYPVTLTVTAVGGCSVTATGSALVNAFPVLGFTATQPCDGTPAVFTNTTTNPASIAAWHWDFDNNTLGGSDTSNVMNPSYTFTAPAGFIGAQCYPVVLTATATTGCAGSYTGTVNVHANPIAFFQPYENCLGNASQIVDSSFVTNPTCLNDAITTWQFAFGDGNTATYNSTNLPTPINYTYSNCGTYQMTLTVTTNNNCTDTFNVTGFDVFCLPVVTAPPSFSICPGTQVNIAQTTFTTTCAQPELVAPFAFLQINNVNPTTNHLTTHGGIPLSDTLGLDSIPVYTAIAQNLTCDLLVDTVYGLAVTYIDQTEYCVGNEAFFTISVYPTPTVTPITDITVCANQQVNVPAFSGCPTPETFTWSTTAQAGGNIGVAATGTGNVAPFTGTNTANTPAVTTLSVTPLANGCIGTSSGFSITVNPIPAILVTSATVCPSTPPTIIITVPSPIITTNIPAPGVVTYSWTATNNTNIGMSASGTGIPAAYTAPTNTTLTNQIGYVTYIPTYQGCVGVGYTDTINIKPTPYMQHIPDQYWCPFNMTNPVTFASFPASVNTTYNWNFNIGGIPTNSVSPIFPSVGPTSNPGLTTFSTVVNVVPTLNSCQGPDSSFTIFVYPQPQPDFAYNPVCVGQPMSFTNTSMPNAGVNAVTNWSWNFGNGQTGIGQEPSSTFQSPGTQTVTLIATTSPNPPLTNGVPGCADTITLYPFVNPNPVANFYGDSIGCPPFSTQFHDNSSVTIGVVPTGSIASWTWAFNSINNPNPVTYQTATPPTLQNYNNTDPIMPFYATVSLTVTTAAGCKGTKTVKNYIEVYPRPIAGFSWGPTDADINDPTINFANQSSGASEYTVTTPPTYGNYGIEYYLGDIYAPKDSVNYVYSNGNFSYAYNNDANQLQTNDTAYYTVTQWVINQYGCTDSISHIVDIQPVFTFYIPNAFTPNGDGKNEGFKGEGIGINNNTYNMWVFDRWGMMIYYTTDINKAWDGHMKGNDGAPLLQEDVYVWKVQFDDFSGKQHQYHGTVTLLR